MKITVVLILVIGLLISACNLPAIGSTDPKVATAAALTVQAALNNSASTPLASPANTGLQATPTFSQPMASVGDVTNCRKGPGTNYERITQVMPNDEMRIIGFFSPNYWVVSTKNGECWLSGEFTTPVGSFALVPTVTAPPTPVGKAPIGVSLQKWDISCNYQTGQADVTIKWSDKDDETGYRIVRNGAVIAELPPNTTQFIETISLLAGQSVGYNVEAFNLIGSTTSSKISLYC